MRMQMVFCHVKEVQLEVPQGPQVVSLAGMSQVSLLEEQDTCGVASAHTLVGGGSFF